MKKIVSNVLIVATQLIVGGLFLFMLFSDGNEDSRVVVVENDNLNKMSDAVSELFIVEQANKISVDETKVVDLITEEEKEAIEAEKAKAEAEAKALAEAEQKAKEEEEAKKALEAEEAAKEQEATVVVDNSVAALQSYAYDLVINTYGWTEADFDALVSLWNKESGWNYAATGYSGAYGIPQALPGDKMASAGSDYRTNGQTQIRWGLGYISERYGSPSNAWNHFLNNNWY